MNDRSVDGPPGRDAAPPVSELPATNLTAEALDALADATRVVLRERGTPRLLQLFDYLWAARSAAEGQKVNAYAIAFDVYGKPSSFDPVRESNVRVDMHRLRGLLQALADDPDNSHSHAIIIPPRVYLPEVVGRGAAAPPRRISRFPKRWLGWSAAAAAAVAACLALLAVMLPFISRQGFCDSARPQVVMPKSIEAFGTTLTSFRQNLMLYLGYYTMVDVIEPGEPICKGAPVFHIRVDQADEDRRKGLTVTISETPESTPIWRNTYDFDPVFPAERKRETVGRIAYEIGNYNGIVPLSAAEASWDDRKSYEEFACLALAHVYFISFSKQTWEQARACLTRYLPTSTHADIGGMLAAIELDPRISGEPGAAGDDKAYAAALTKAMSINPNDVEVLIVRARYYRTPPTRNIAQGVELIGRMKRLYPYHPDAVNQVAIGLLKLIGDEEAGAPLVGRYARMTGADDGVVLWSKIYLAILRNDFPAIARFIPSLADSGGGTLEGLVLIGFGDASSDQLSIDRGKKMLRLFECDTHDCLVTFVNNAGFNRQSAKVLTDIINRHFPQSPRPARSAV